MYSKFTSSPRWLLLHTEIACSTLFLSVNDASDWGRCFSSCVLYELIWLETFALLGAKRWRDASWHIVTSLPITDCRLSSEVWCSTLQPAVTQISPHCVFDRRRFSIICEVKKHNHLATSLALKELRLCRLVEDKTWSCADREKRMLHGDTLVLSQEQTEPLLFKNI